MSADDRLQEQQVAMRGDEQFEIDGVTIVHDRKRSQRVMTLRGVVVLPIGAEIELCDPNVSARVTGVRLCAGGRDRPASVCLDVEVPSVWWGSDE